MSINIDEAKLRKALFASPTIDTCLIRGHPLVWWNTFVTYDGDWLKVTGVVAAYPAITTGVSLHLSADYGLRAQATLKIDTDTSTYMFFFEPYKADYANYQGIDTRDGAVHYARSRNASAETKTDIDPQDWTAETLFKIKHEADQTDVYFYLGGVEVAHHTTNISAQPYEICCAEPNGVVRQVSLKYPPGIVITKD